MTVFFFTFLGVPETTKPGTGISSSGRDAGVVAGIVVAVISGVIILTALVRGVYYRYLDQQIRLHYLRDFILSIYYEVTHQYFISQQSHIPIEDIILQILIVTLHRKSCKKVFYTFFAQILINHRSVKCYYYC